MLLLARVAALAGIVLMALFAAVVAMHLATGRVSLSGLLYTKEAGGERVFSPARLQMLIATLVVAARYLFLVLQHPGLDAMPDLPPSVIAVVGGSHMAYLGGKAFATYIQPLLKNLK
jgi:hypothetical protein